MKVKVMIADQTSPRWKLPQLRTREEQEKIEIEDAEYRAQYSNVTELPPPFGAIEFDSIEEYEAWKTETNCTT